MAGPISSQPAAGAAAERTLPKAPTGIGGLDEITGGGIPQGRATLVTGGTGSGKTLLGLQFPVAGAREYGEPGVLVTFEESAEKVSANVASLGFDLDGLKSGRAAVVHAFRMDPSEVVETGEFDFEPLFLLLGDTIERYRGEACRARHHRVAVRRRSTTRRPCGRSSAGCSAGSRSTPSPPS